MGEPPADAKIRECKRMPHTTSMDESMPRSSSTVWRLLQTACGTFTMPPTSSPIATSLGYSMGRNTGSRP